MTSPAVTITGHERDMASTIDGGEMIELSRLWTALGNALQAKDGWVVDPGMTVSLVKRLDGFEYSPTFTGRRVATTIELMQVFKHMTSINAKIHGGNVHLAEEVITSLQEVLRNYGIEY